MPGRLSRGRFPARRQANADVAAVHAGSEDGHRAGGRQAEHPARRQIRTRAVQPALDGAAGHLTLGQWHRLMGALIAQRTDGASGTDQAHGAAAEVKMDWAAAADLVQTAGPHPAASCRAGAAHRQPARWSPGGSRAAGPAHPARTGSSR